MSGCFQEDGGGSLPISVMGTTCDPTGTGRTQGEEEEGTGRLVLPFLSFHAFPWRWTQTDPSPFKLSS